jgi:hypothetical protein
LTVPYWNCSAPSQRGCPDIFAEPDPDPATQKPRNPLYDPRRNLVWVFGLGDLNDNAVSTKNVLSSSKYFDSALPQNAVGGSWKDREPVSKGAMEQSPHDNIHFITGGVIGDTGGGLMASPRTSAHDPLFWVHHSNIDRLWNVWGCQQTSSWGDPPPDAWWDEKAWWFYDFDGTAANLPRRSYIDSRALGYAFDDEDLSCTPVSSQPPPSPPLVLAQQFDLMVDLPRAEFPGLALSTSADAQATLPVDDQLSIQTFGINKLQQQVMLELADVTFAEPPLVGFAVYAWTDQQPQPIELGTLNLFGLQHDDQMHSSQRGQRFDITDLFKGPRAFHVLIRPFELLSLKPGSAPLPRRDGVRIGTFRVLVVRRENTGLKQ